MSEGVGDEPSLAASLKVPPTSDERLAALEGERDRAQAAIRDLEAKLAAAVASRTLLNERARFRRAVLVAVLGLVGVLAIVFLTLSRGFC